MRTTTRFGNIVLGLTLVIALGAIAPLAHASPDAGPSTGPPVQLSAVQGNETAPDVVPGDWWGRVQEDIRRSEYHVTWQDFTYLPDLEHA